MKEQYSGARIRQEYIDFFIEHRHTFVPSSSLVPGGDSTLLFTNAGMVQFKEVFLGTDKRPYTRATDSQKCMRVAGKHNDLDDVGRDDMHHTFFEMLGNWSFGDYYKKEAISWAWQLLTDVWGLSKDRIWATCFMDEKGEIPADDEAAEYWRQQPGIIAEHVLFSGRKDNFWEMAETGPCGPCSEIHFDRGEEYCDKKDVRDHVCGVNGDCLRFLELWNLVFIQYNRTSATHLDPLPAKHVDTGMGLDRIVSILQDVDSNYKTDLFTPLMEVIRSLTGYSEAQMYEDFTPFRVIADHARSASFLIADGVVPGNTSRNYVCRMIIRRAARFGSKIGLTRPFLAKVAESVIETYGDFYPELVNNRQAILDNLTREEVRFTRTVENAVANLTYLLDEFRERGEKILPGPKAFELYATYGLPLEITRDIAREQDMDVDEAGFRKAMEGHRVASSAGKAFGSMGGEDVEVYSALFKDLLAKGELKPDGVGYDPYHDLEFEGQVLALVVGGEPVADAQNGDLVELLMPKTGFYVESGGQVSDTGLIRAANGNWEIEVTGMRKPAAGVIVHVGEVINGQPKVGDKALAMVDIQRRHDIMRNHTATHLLHAELRAVLGDHARQAGSLVAPDRLRFDFTHPEALTQAQLEEIEHRVNEVILSDYQVTTRHQSLTEAVSNGAMALFGEKYAEEVQTVSIGQNDQALSYELCGGTHLDRTGDVGVFLITSEGSAAAGIRRIEAVTGRSAYDLVDHRLYLLRQISEMLETSPGKLLEKVNHLLSDLSILRKEVSELRKNLVSEEFARLMDSTTSVAGVDVLTGILKDADPEILRQMADRFRQFKPTNGVAVLASVIDNKPLLIASVTNDLVKRGLHAGELIKSVAIHLGGSGGGKPTLAQAGGKDPAKLDQALSGVVKWVDKNLKE
jgi:alanyl-tRNA synthetase